MLKASSIKPKLKTAGILAVFIILVNFFSVLALDLGSVPALNLLDSDYFKVTLEYSGTDFEINTVETEAGNFTQLVTATGQYSSEIGKPQLPVIRAMVQIPFGATPYLQITDYQYDEYPGQELGIEEPVYPLQQPQIKLPNQKNPFIIDQQFYDGHSYLFAEPVVIIDNAVARGYHILLIEIRPVDYNPAENNLKVVKSLNFNINLSGSDYQLTREMKTRYYSAYFEEMFSGLLLNPGAYFSPDWVPALDIGMIIVYESGFASQLSDLVHWKMRKGFKVDFKTDAELGGTANGVRNYIQNQYDSGLVPPDFVLLVGDVGQIPTFSGEESGSASDLPFSLMDVSDYLPDLMVGRLSLTNTTQVSEMVGRIVTYEKREYSSFAWMDKACFPASDDSWYWDLAEATHRYAIQTWYGPRGFQCDSIWAHSGGTGIQVMNAVNNGRMIVNYSGHGSETSWAGPSVSQAMVQAASNNNMYPFVISNACLTGKFSRDECFGETWIRQDNGGALAFFGASNNSYWDEDDVLERRMYDDVFEDEYYLIGGMAQRGLYGVYLTYPSNAEYYYDMYNILGDPSVALWFRQPMAMNVTHPDITLPGASNISATVTSGGSPLQNALVCITNDGSIHKAGYTNSSGSVSLAISDATMGDTLFITVTAYNKIPYFGTIIVSGNQPYLVYSSSTVNDDEPGESSGDNDGIIDIGETIEMQITLRNNGSVDALSVTGILSTTDPYITITDGLNSFGNIPAGTNKASLTPYIFRVNVDCPDNHVVPLVLQATDSEDSTWNIDFQVTVRAPVLDFLSYELLDTPPGGDGDGFPEPGEICDLNISIINNGGETARSITGILSDITDPYITVTTSSASYGNLIPSASSISSHSYTFSINTSCPSPHISHFSLDFSTAIGFTDSDTFSILIGEGGMSDDIEGGIGGWTSSGWQRTQFRSNTPGNSWYCGDEITHLYPDLSELDLTSSSVILPANSILSFWHFYSTEAGFDSGFVQINSGSGWTTVEGFTGLSKKWLYRAYDLSSLTAGSEIQVRFKMKSDNYVHGEGWYIDDFYIGPEHNGYLGAGTVYPLAGSDTTGFNFSVNYISHNGYAPTTKNIVLDGAAYPLSTTDYDYTDGSAFTFSSSMPNGVHNYYFEFTANGQVIRFPRTGYLTGPYVDNSLHFLNVGSSSSGITTGGPWNDWEWGIPTYGPSGVPFGSNVWATKLASAYRDSSRSKLILPSIDLTEAAWAFLKIAHWYRFQTPNSYGYHDGGNIKISVDGGDPVFLYPQEYYDVIMSQYNRYIPWELSYADVGNGNFWHFSTFDLRPYVGHNVQIFFNFGSSSVNVEAGWYISNIYIIGSEATGIQLVSPEPKIPSTLTISQNIPNPFNSQTIIKYALPEKGPVNISLFDILGNKITTLADGVCEPGEYETRWDGKQEDGQLAPSGIYFCRISHGSRFSTISMLLIR
ncbi:hypothetical protein JW877_05045 [bacterium]|nr:hypothetical protein [bacterium]